MVAMSHRQQADISTSHWSGSMWDASVWEHWLDIMASGRHRLHIVLTECSLLFYQKKNKKKTTHYPSGPAVSSSHKSPKKKCRETKKVLNRQNFISPISLTFFCSQHLASLLGFYCCSQIVHASAEQTMTLIIDDTSIKTIPSDGIWMGWLENTNPVCAGTLLNIQIKIQ